jgi:hypothetical protein
LPRFSQDTYLEFTVHSLGVKQAVLQAVQIPGGSARVYPLTVDPMLKLTGVFCGTGLVPTSR